VNQLLEDRAAPRHPSDGGGRAWIETSATADRTVASGRGRFVVVYEAGRSGIDEGGAVRLIVSPFWHWTPAQTDRGNLPGYTTAETDADGIQLNLSTPSFVNIEIQGRKLEPGEQIRITYGAGPPEAQIDRYAERGSRFWIGVDGDGDGVHKLIDDSPGVDVEPGPAAQMLVVLPSTARPGETVTVRTVVLDAAGNTAVPFAGSVELTATPPWPGLPSAIAIEPQDLGVKTLQVAAGTSGVFRILAHAVADDEERRTLEALSNPLLVEDSDNRILWGDLHGHTALSDGTGTVEDYLLYARDVAGLDVVALTDHDHWGFTWLDESPDLWAAVEERTQSLNDPGRFVTILGYEWTNWIHGHRHVLYFGERGELFSSLDEEFDTPPELWEALRGKHALTFAHHSAGGPVPTNWEFAPDPDLEPVTEICSVHGSSEAGDSPSPIYNPVPGNWVRDVLDRGYRFGFIGSGDSHDGHPGLAHLDAGKGGLAAILSEQLTRDGVYDALSSRRTYATNGPRIILRTALAGHPMGSELQAADLSGPVTLYVRVLACAPLERIDVIRSGSVWQSSSGENAFDLESVFDLGTLTSGEYVYVRAVQTDGGAAWSTPFYVN
jgi:hypothetical protein